MNVPRKYICIECDGLFYIADTHGLDTVEDYLEKFSEQEYELTEDEALEAAEEAYWDNIYDHSMDGPEIEKVMNHLWIENLDLALTNKKMIEFMKSEGYHIGDFTNWMKGDKDRICNGRWRFL